MPPLPFDLSVELSEPVRFILNLGAAVAAALIGGIIAVRLRLPAIVGYLVAGVAIGPFTPGFVGDVGEIAVLADVGIVLLLFALGVEFSIRELRDVGRVAVPGGVAQIAGTLAVGALCALLLGFEVREAFVIGACLSISSTLVVLKSLIDRGELDSLHGRVAVGWSIVQDIATIVFIVALPPLAGSDVVGPILLAIGKAALFLALAYLGGTRFLPFLFSRVARLGSPELFLLAVVATALLTAFVSSAVFGLSLALGAFVAGLLVSETDESHQAAAEVIPFRDLFAVLFFVSVGMLVDPVALVADLPLVLLLVAVAVVVKGLLTGGSARALGLPTRSAILLGTAMAQVGEFSFIIAEDALGLELIDARVYNVILGTALVSILVGPILLAASDRVVPRLERQVSRDLTPLEPTARAPSRYGPPPVRSESAMSPEEAERRPSIVVLGAGRVGRTVVRAARTRGFRCVVVDRDPRRLEEAAELGAATVYGDAANPEILRRVGLDRARVLVIAIGDPLTTRLAAERAQALSPRISIAARARGRREIGALRGLGLGRVADPEAEASFELARHALQRMGVSGMELSGIVQGLRRDAYGPDRG
jgi:monovalent cation:H+ antiporter-2, CPA2 family